MSSFSYARYDNSRRQRPITPASTRRTTLGYWIPLAVTVTIATVGIAAWIWNERRDAPGSGDDSTELREETSSHRERDSPPRRRRTRSNRRDGYRDENVEIIVPDDLGEDRIHTDDEGVVADQHSSGQPGSLVARMTDVIRRTPSPQQLFTAASRSVSAAAGAMLDSQRSLDHGSGILGPFTGEEFAHVEREGWSEEVEKRGVMKSDIPDNSAEVQPRTEQKVSKSQAVSSRKVVTIVLDAASHGIVTEDKMDEGDYRADHNSILSGIPSMINRGTTQLLILIYAPHLNTQPHVVKEMVSSDELGLVYTDLLSAAINFVAHPTHVLPFSSPTGYIHLLRHLGPSLVYVEESLCGGEHWAERITAIEGWVGKVVVVTRDRPIEEQKASFGSGVEVIKPAKIEGIWRSTVDV